MFLTGFASKDANTANMPRVSIPLVPGAVMAKSRNRTKRKSESATIFDGRGPAAQARPSKIVAIEVKHRSSTHSEVVYARKYDCDCTIDAYNARGQLSDRQWLAGSMFRDKWRRTKLHRLVTTSYGLTRGSVPQSDDVAAVFEHNRRVVNETLEELGADLSALVIRVCGEDEWAGTNGLRPLQIALDWIAELWGLDKQFSRDPAKRTR